jgi:VanZ family protein
MKKLLPFLHPAIPAVLLVVWFTGLWMLSSMKGDQIDLPSFDHADKVAHFSYFLAGGFLFAWMVRRSVKWTDWRIALLTLALMGAVGAVDEVHQFWTPGRSGADHGDWLADVSGGLAGAWIFLIIYGFVTRTAHSEAPAGD